MNDLDKFKKHINDGYSAVLLVNIEQFNKGTGLFSKAPYGDHFVVVDGGVFEYSIEKNTVRMRIYDNHKGSVERVMDLDTFLDMTNHALMIKKREKTEDTKTENNGG